jgi:cell division protein FtsX
MQLNQDIILIITITVTLALVGLFILSMYLVASKTSLQKNLTIKLDLYPGSLIMKGPALDQEADA